MARYYISSGGNDELCSIYLWFFPAKCWINIKTLSGCCGEGFFLSSSQSCLFLKVFFTQKSIVDTFLFSCSVDRCTNDLNWPNLIPRQLEGYVLSLTTETTHQAIPISYFHMYNALTVTLCQALPISYYHVYSALPKLLNLSQVMGLMMDSCHLS